MTDLETFLDVVHAFLPDASIEVDAPDANTPGSTFVTVALGGRTAWVEWRPGEGFGVSASVAPGYGEGPDEVIASPAVAARRVIDLVSSGARSIPPREVFLAELRNSRGLSQRRLAELLGVQQAAVSKAERKGETMSIQSLREVVEALGGTLELHARFGTEEVKLSQFRGERAG